MNQRMLRTAIPLIIALVGIGGRFVTSKSSADTSTKSGSSANSGTLAKSSSATDSGTSSDSGSAAVDRSIGFRSASTFASHYEKHGREFGNISKAKYLGMAQELRDAPLSSTVIQTWQARGNWARYDRSSGSFIAFRKDKVILTFFRPDDGEDYFRRASARTP